LLPASTLSTIAAMARCRGHHGIGDIFVVDS
jgi:hypothetical protein